MTTQQPEGEVTDSDHYLRMKTHELWELDEHPLPKTKFVRQDNAIRYANMRVQEETAALVDALENISGCFELEPHGGNPMLNGLEKMKELKQHLQVAQQLIAKRRKG